MTPASIEGSEGSDKIELAALLKQPHREKSDRENVE